ncbi:hypothetical protein EBZ38_05315 [bacterium]|nr:hypothetical protein [bacterium]
MLMYTTLLAFGVLYIFRGRLYRYITFMSLTTLYWMAKWIYMYYRLWKRAKDSSFIKGKVYYICNAYKIVDYTYFYNDHKNVLSFVYTDPKNLKRQMDAFDPEVLEYKTKFLNCSIVDSKGGYVLDTTQLLRQFVMYLKGPSAVTIGMFMEYVNKVHPQLMHHPKCELHTLSVYMNDDYFTERVFILDTQQNTQLYEMVN